MNYRYVTVDDLIMLTLEGEVDLVSWEKCFIEQARLFRAAGSGYKRLLIDGTGLNAFSMTSLECMEMAPGFASYADKAAFFCDDKLIFGMMRIIHSCAFNDEFQVFKTRADAASFLTEHNGKSQPA